ncbi:glycosyltransferase [Methylosinus sp. Sm6]|uniref:glycosyltransferase n=1 Tax=Methylosinus sp. Sm6 TaxID=2866948 RepID=UPI001C98E881|nr:glycosyltransferase [Methylosinus sp. Sm6]MBY6240968.1 glycosyltransferase [Methylosinus sp. Sm6]
MMSFGKTKERLLRAFLNEKRFFDEKYYLQTHPDVAKTRMNPFAHFMRHGWREGRNPSEAFDTLYYSATRDLLFETNALTHYVDRVWPRSEGLKPATEDEIVAFQLEKIRPYVDEGFYRARYGVDKEVDAAEHYLRIGWKLLFDPSPFFSTEQHLAAHPFVRALSASPLYHRLATRPEGLSNLGVASRAALAANIERVDPHSIVGWAYDRASPDQPVTLDVRIDGIFYAQATANIARRDLRKLDLRIVGGGFEILLPPGAGRAVVDILWRGASIAGAPSTVDLRPHRPRIVSSRRARRPLTIIAPIHDAPQETRRCLESVLRHTNGSVSLLLIDDASAKAEIAALLGAFEGLPQVEARRNAETLGFTRCVNLGLEIARGCDVILLTSDTEVGPRWADNLQNAAYSAEDVASVSAISDNAGAFTVPDMHGHAPLQPGWTIEDYQRLILQRSPVFLPETPTGNGVCMFLRRDAVDEIGGFDAQFFPFGPGAESDWSMRAGRKSWRHLIDDRTLVSHVGSAGSQDQSQGLAERARTILEQRYPDYRALTNRFNLDPRINAVRHGVRRLREEMASNLVETPRPRVLFVISTLTGGTPLTNRDLMRGVRDRFEAWLLHCDRRMLTLTKVGLDESNDEIVERRELDEPIDIIDHSSRSYAEIVSDWLARYAIELVHIRHLAWHSSALPKIAKGAGIAVVMSFHDFYSVCPSLKLLDETGRYCGGICTPTPGDCVPELWNTQNIPPLKGAWVFRWREIFAEAFEFCDAFVTTSNAAKAILEAVFPRLAGRVDIIEHGRDFAHFHAPRVRAPRSAPVDILAPGNISSAKGRDLILSLAALDVERRLRFHLVGNVSPPIESPGVVTHSPYSREQFAERFLETGARVGAILSTWPETHCHTLTELWSAGMPVIGLDFGAVAERIRATGAGWVSKLDSIQELYREICRITCDSDEIARAQAAVAAWQENEGAINTVAFMATRYEQLYRETLLARTLGSASARRGREA